MAEHVPGERIVDLSMLIELAGPCADDEGLVIADARGDLVFSNDRAVDILGIVRIGAGVDDYSALHGVFTEEGRPYPSTDLPLARAILHQKTSRDVRLLLKRPDGICRRLSVSARPLLDAGKALVGAVVVFRALPPLS